MHSSQNIKSSKIDITNLDISGTNTTTACEGMASAATNKKQLFVSLRNGRKAFKTSSISYPQHNTRHSTTVEEMNIPVSKKAIYEGSFSNQLE